MLLCICGMTYVWHVVMHLWDDTPLKCCCISVGWHTSDMLLCICGVTHIWHVVMHLWDDTCLTCCYASVGWHMAAMLLYICGMTYVWHVVMHLWNETRLTCYCVFMDQDKSDIFLVDLWLKMHRIFHGLFVVYIAKTDLQYCVSLKGQSHNFLHRPQVFHQTAFPGPIRGAHRAITICSLQISTRIFEFNTDSPVYASQRSWSEILM